MLESWGTNEAEIKVPVVREPSPDESSYIAIAGAQMLGITSNMFYKYFGELREVYGEYGGTCLFKDGKYSELAIEEMEMLLRYRCNRFAVRKVLDGRFIGVLRQENGQILSKSNPKKPLSRVQYLKFRWDLSPELRPLPSKVEAEYAEAIGSGSAQLESQAVECELVVDEENVEVVAIAPIGSNHLQLELEKLLDLGSGLDGTAIGVRQDLAELGRLTSQADVLAYASGYLPSFVEGVQQVQERGKQAIAAATKKVVRSKG